MTANREGRAYRKRGRLRELWLARPKHWYAAPFLLGGILLIWYLTVANLEAAHWNECQVLYERARTASDTALVDQTVPGMSTKALKPEPCGVLRALR